MHRICQDWRLASNSSSRLDTFKFARTWHRSLNLTIKILKGQLNNDIKDRGRKNRWDL